MSNVKFSKEVVVVDGINQVRWWLKSGGYVNEAIYARKVANNDWRIFNAKDVQIVSKELKSKKEVSEFLAVFSMKSEEQLNEEERQYNKEMSNLHLKNVEKREEEMREEIFNTIENSTNKEFKELHNVDFNIEEGDYIVSKISKVKNLHSIGYAYALEVFNGGIFEIVNAQVEKIIKLNMIDYDNFVMDINDCNISFSGGGVKYESDDKIQLVSVVIAEDRLPIVVNCHNSNYAENIGFIDNVNEELK